MTNSDKPIHIHEEIDLNEWKNSLTYDEKHIRDIITHLLINFEIKPTDKNIGYLRGLVKALIKHYEEKYKLSPQDDETRNMLEMLIIRMAYDRLYIDPSKV